jgi:ATP-binding cassette subfamily B protein
MQIGALTAFLSYLLQVLMAVMMSTFMLMMYPRAEVCADRIEEVLDTQTSVTPPAAPVTELRSRGHLELRGVEFRYPGAEAPVLADISFATRPGEVTAIIGSTGSGKTTLLNLVPRLVDATAGEVLVGGVNVTELAPETLALAIGIVPQKPYLFSGTIASNLRYGRPDATDDELWSALATAQATGFVTDLDAAVSQGGTNVSGGQRQRLAIARALVHKPDIYLFDDSFSALDYATDAALRADLVGQTQDATVVIVAQRVATIRNASRIIVLDQGRIVGQGTHRELMDTNETYREIVLSQLTEQEAAA